MKPLAVILTDTHIKDGNEELIESIFKQAFDACEQLGINTLIHCGDWFAYRSLRFESSLKCFLMIQKILDRASDRNVTIYSIQGNHDKPDLTSEHGYMDLFRYDKALKIYKTQHCVRLAGNSNIVFCFLPYFKEGIEYLTRLEQLIYDVKKYFPKDKKILITHASINGVRNNDGSCVEGDAQMNYFDTFDLVLTGHYHDRQQLSETIHYIGSAYQANFGESDAKGFAVLFDDLSIDYIQSEFKNFVKIYVEVEAESDLKELFSQLQEHIKYNNSVGNRVQIVFKGSQDKLSTIDLRDPLFKGIEVKCEPTEIDVMFDKIEDAELIVFNKKNIAQGWRDYAKKRNIDSIKIQKGLIMLTTSRI